MEKRIDQNQGRFFFFYIAFTHMMKIADGIEDGGMSSGNTFGQTSSAARIEYISKVFFCFDLGPRWVGGMIEYQIFEGIDIFAFFNLSSRDFIKEQPNRPLDRKSVV